MSKVFSKNKGKRSRSSSNEANNSFVKNVTSRVTGLLPATITKWFSSPKPTDTNGSVAIADSDSSTEEEVATDTVVTQPPAKRMRFSSTMMPGSSNHFGIDETVGPITYPELDHTRASTSFSVSSPSRNNMFRQETNFLSTSVGNLPTADRLDETTDQDSSRYKSHMNFAATPIIERAEVETTQETPVFKPQHTVSQLRSGRSVEKKRKSLFYKDTPNRDQSIMKACAKSSSSPIKDSNQPCFKASLLGSPFYPGRTMYGGAGACTYLNEPNVKQRKVAVVNEASNANNTISTAARRVMDLLEHYSSPLIEAKRISQFSRNASEMDTSGDSSMTFTNRIKSYKTQELHVPSVAAFLRLKHRNRLMESTSSARQIMASQSSTADFLPYSTTTTLSEQNPDSSKFTTKMKSRVTKRQPIRDVDYEFTPAVELPTGTLLIDQNNLPKFSFEAPTRSVTVSNDNALNSKQTAQTKTTDVQSKTNETLCKINALNNDNFKFSSPIVISPTNPQNESKTNAFSFGSPDRNVDKKKDNVSCVVGRSPISTNKSKEWKCADCWVSNKQADSKCVCCGGPKPSTEPENQAKCTTCKVANALPNNTMCTDCKNTDLLNHTQTPDKKWKCSDCWVANDETAEKCVCCGAKNTNISKKSTISDSKNDTKWKCNDCWIMNNDTSDKCVACGGTKPGAKPPAPVKSTSTSLGFKFGIPAADSSETPQAVSNSLNSLNDLKKTPVANEQSNCLEWRCSDCWIMNKSSLLKCVACGGAKPGEKKDDTVDSVKSYNNLSSLVKTQSNKWECGSCLVRNESDKMKCVCCEADKPGTEGQPSQTKYNFGNVQNTSFKFGIPNNQDKTTLVETKPIENKKVESETNNNVLPKTSFLFSAPDKKESADNIEKFNDLPKTTGFKFGVPNKSIAIKSNPALVNFPSSSKTPVKENVDDKEQEVPKMPELKQLPITNSTNTTQLTSIPDKSDAKDKLNCTSSPLISPPSYFSMPAQTKDSSSNPQIVPSATTAASESQPTFSFSAGSSIGSANTGITLNRKTSLTTATVTSLQTSEPANTVPVVQKTETSTSAVSTPLFSFGSSSHAPAADATASTLDSTPKFQFTFGNNSKKLAFPSPFGTGDTTKASGNIFTGNTVTTSTALPAANSLTTSITIPTNNIFQTSTQKENMWSAPPNNTASTTAIFVTNTVTTAVQKPPAFSFGPSTTTPAFGVNAAVNSTPIFGNPVTTNATPTFGSSSSTNAAPAFGTNASTNATPAFGSNSAASAIPAFGKPTNATPSFGNSTSSSTNMFVAGSGTTPAFGANAAPFGTAATNATPTFGSAAPTFGSGSTFGSAQTTAQPAFGSATTTNVFGMGNQNSNPSTMFASPGLNSSATTLFGSPQANSTAIQTPAFGASATTFEPAASFNFGSPASQSTGMFGFGQQQQPAQAGIYNFGGAPGTPVQFSMGSGPASGLLPNTGGRKIRKATRRTNAPR